MFIKYSLLVEDCTPRKKVVDKSDYRLHYYEERQDTISPKKKTPAQLHFHKHHTLTNLKNEGLPIVEF